MKELLELLEDVSDILPDGISEKAYREAFVSAALDIDITKVTKESISKTYKDLAFLGLFPNTDQAFLKIVKGKLDFGTGYQGLLEILYRDPNVESVNAEVVYKNDIFQEVKGVDRDLIHQPNYGVKRFDDDITHAYAIVRTTRGDSWDVVERVDIDKARAMSDGIPWKKWFSSMCKKTAILRLGKYLPKSKRLEAAVKHEYKDLKEKTTPKDVVTKSLEELKVKIEATVSKMELTELTEQVKSIAKSGVAEDGILNELRELIRTKHGEFDKKSSGTENAKNEQRSE